MYKVKFSEDNWKTVYDGTVVNESPYFYYVKSFKYGNRWISKSSCEIIEKIEDNYEK